MNLIVSIFKVLLALAMGIMAFGIFLCFGGNNLDDFDMFYFYLCLAIGIGLFIASLYALFQI